MNFWYAYYVLLITNDLHGVLPLHVQVVEVDIHCPQTWCVVGNCFSLQKEPEVALKYFSRALQVVENIVAIHHVILFCDSVD